MKRTWWLVATAVMAAGMLAAPAWADIIVVVPGVPLDQLINRPEGMTVIDKTFTNFTYRATAQGGALAPTAAGVTVYGIQATFTDRVEYGLLFQGSWSADGNKSVDSLITYRVEANAPFLISDNTLWMVGSARDGGMASVTELVTLRDPPQGIQDVVANKMVFCNDLHPLDRLFEHAVYPDANRIIYISKDIQVNGGTLETGSAAISAVYQTFSQVPEPGTMALLALGSLAVVVRRRRIRRP